MKQLTPLFKREFFGYFRSPVAYVFIIIFLLGSAGCTFFLGRLLDTNQASLEPFFQYLPWLYMVLVPAVGMRLWAEERKSGTIELLFTLPVQMSEAVLAKFLAGWAFLALSLVLTFPLILTVNYLGDPDNGVIFAGYLGALLMAAAFLSISCFTSALSKNQVISFILGVIISFVAVLLGWGVFSDLLMGIFSVPTVDLIAELGFTSHFMSLSRGLIDVRDLFYFFSVVVFFLAANTMTLNVKKAA